MTVVAAIAAPGQANPAPLINQPLVPDAVSSGGPAFTLTVNGTGFVSGSVVQWNGAALSTQFVSASQLTASVPASDIAVASTATVTVSNPALGGGVSNPQFFFITSSRAAVALTELPGRFGESSTGSVAIADFNGDGKLDVVVTNVVPGTISIQLGNGDGTFGSPTNYATGADPWAVAVADMNHDGKLDLAVTATGQNEISVLLGNGDGTFQPHVDYAVGTLGDDQFSLAFGDFNADGNLDLAVCNLFDGTVSILLGNGDGTFQSQTTFPSVDCTSMAVGDFNRDGRLDLAVVSGFGVQIWLGNGDGTFSVGQFISSRAQAAVTADVNADGILDLATVGDQVLSIALGNGDGTFQAPVGYATANSPVSLALEDLNGGGKLDAAVMASSMISILLGNGDGTFQNHVDEPADPASFSIVGGDLNGDGFADVATNSSAFLQTTIAFSPTALSFGSVEVGSSSAPLPVTLTNLGSTALAISSITTTAQFAQTNNCGSSLPAGGNCTINVTFSPSSSGSQGGSLTVTDSAVGSPQSVALSGFGTQPAVTLTPGPLTFPQQLIDTIKSLKETLINTGTANLIITSITVSGQFAQHNNCSATMLPGESCAITVEFKPLNIGPFTGTLSIPDNAPGSPQKASLTGTGTAFTVSPSSLNFGKVKIGQSSGPQTVTVTNFAQVSEKISAIKLVGGGNEFSETNNCGSTLGAGATCAINVTFSPTRQGTLDPTLQVLGGGGVFDVIMSGTGTN